MEGRRALVPDFTPRILRRARVDRPVAQDGSEDHRRLRQRFVSARPSTARSCAISRAGAATANSHRDRRRRHGRTECRLASGQARLPRFRAAGNGTAGRRQFALGRKRNLEISLGRALCSRARQRRIAGARTVRRTGRVPRWQMGRTRVVLRSAGAPVHQWPLAGRHRAGRRRDADGIAQQYRRFMDKINEFRATGQFTFPMERGARPSPLDRMSMADWLAQQGFDSAPLRWYINYACRDDYGALAKDTSAWAGVQYFASREPEEKGPLTWPEGNGWIAARLIEKLQRYLRTGDVVYRVARSGNTIRVLTEADRIHRGRRHLRRSDVSRVLHHRRCAARGRISIFALADRQPDARSHPWPKERRTGLGQRDLRFAHARLCECDAHESGDAHRSNGLDVLLVAGRARARTTRGDCCSLKIGTIGKRRS